MNIRQVNRSDKDTVLLLLDNFRTACIAIIDPSIKGVSTTAREAGRPIFDRVVSSDSSAIFLAIDGAHPIGIVTVHTIPQIRKGDYCAEIEEMFVEPAFQGKGVAGQLVDAASVWAKERGVKTIRLESHKALGRAHGFYEKVGFKQYGLAYERKIA